MGKCVSKDQHLQQIREIDERAYISISDEFEYYHYEVRNLTSVEFLKTVWTPFCKDGSGCNQESFYIDSKDEMFFHKQECNFHCASVDFSLLLCDEIRHEGIPLNPLNNSAIL